MNGKSILIFLVIWNIVWALASLLIMASIQDMQIKTTQLVQKISKDYRRGNQ